MTNSWRIAIVAAAALIAAGVLVAPALSAPGKDKVYTIANYPVEASAQDAVAAKEKAHAEGQQAALGALLKRLVPVTAYNHIDSLKHLRADDFSNGVAVRSETNSRTQYIASLDFSFQPDAVRGLLQREGVPFVDEQAPRMVLVPLTAVTGEGGSVSYTPASGTWGKVWKVLDLDNTLTPLKIETLLPAIQNDVVAAVINGDDRVEQILTREYKAEFVLFAVAEVDAADKQLNVTIAGIDAAGLLAWKRSYRAADGDMDYAMELAAVVTQGVLEGRWKVAKMEGGGRSANTGGGFGGGGDVRLSVMFSSPDEWADMRGYLLDLPGVDDIRIGAVSAYNAEVTLRYPGGPQGLAPALARHGLVMSENQGYWSLRSGN